MRPKTLKFVGPVAGAFIDSRAFISGIMGPVGGGKTTGAIQRYFKLGLAQQPVWEPDRMVTDNLGNVIQKGCWVKKCRIAAVRDTYPNLDRTLIKSWHMWVPKDVGHWSGDAPRTHKFTVDVGAPGKKGFHKLDMDMIFTAIGDHSVEDVLRGFELTGLHGNEADLLSKEFLEYGVGRIGRYPSPEADGAPCVRSQLFMDFNAPEEDNWLYDLFVNRSIDEELLKQIAAEIGDDTPMIEFFQQPGARDQNAENLNNLPKGYYAKQLFALEKSPDKISRLIDNKFGAVKSGMPVYPEYSDRVHSAPDDLMPMKGVPLRIGMDAGLTPAAVIGQRNSLGQTVILAELATFVEDEDEQLSGIGPTAFGDALADLLATRFAGFPIEFAAVDPAAATGTDGSGNELTWLQYAAKASKLRIRPAPVKNNNLTIRLEAVRRPLTRMVEAGRPGLVISPNCKILRRGFNSGYKYTRTNLAGNDSRYRNEPLKNQYSHVHDALQYLMVASGEGRMVGASNGLDAGKPTKVTVAADYNPFG